MNFRVRIHESPCSHKLSDWESFGMDLCGAYIGIAGVLVKVWRDLRFT
jgi:hypothetical protein